MVKYSSKSIKGLPPLAYFIGCRIRQWNKVSTVQMVGYGGASYIFPSQLQHGQMAWKMGVGEVFPSPTNREKKGIRGSAKCKENLRYKSICSLVPINVTASIN